MRRKDTIPGWDELLETCEEAGSGDKDLYGRRATGFRTVHILSHAYLTLQEDLEGCTKKLRRESLIEDMMAANKSTLTVTWDKKVCHLNFRFADLKVESQQTSPRYHRRIICDTRLPNPDL